MTPGPEPDGSRPAWALPGRRGSPEAEATDPEPPSPDAELLQRHVGGDADAFGLLFRRHRDRLWGVALRTLGDPDEAADALQEAMISAFRGAGSFRGDAAVTTWLHRIVINACLDRRRRRAARPAISGVDEVTLTSAALVTPGPAADSDVSLDVTAALATLPPDQRAALVLVDMLGYPVADAAQILGVSAGTVKSRCSRGRARLLPRLAHLRGGTAGPPAPAHPAPAHPAPAPPPFATSAPAAPPPSPPAAAPPPASWPSAGNRTLPGGVSPAGGGGESPS